MKRMVFLLTLLLFASTNIKAQSGMQQLPDRAAFETAIAGNEKVVVVFAAEWCGYCRDFLPKVESIVKEYEGIKFFRINYDENVSLFETEGIKMTPTTRLYKNGKKADEMVVLEAAPLQEKLRDF